MIKKIFVKAKEMYDNVVNKLTTKLNEYEVENISFDIVWKKFNPKDAKLLNSKELYLVRTKRGKDIFVCKMNISNEAFRRIMKHISYVADIPEEWERIRFLGFKIEPIED